MNATNYRPVSLTSVICNIMESILKDTMFKHLNVNKLIINQQHGFVNNKSCITNLLETLDLLTNALENGFAVDIIFLDLQSQRQKPLTL